MVILIPETLVGILQLIVLILALFWIPYSIYVESRRLKATQRMEKQAHRINEILDGDKVD